MFFVYAGTGAFCVVTLLLWLGWCLVRRRRPRWRALLWLLGIGIPVHALLTVPACLGFLGTRIVHTRSDESAYRGPRFDAAGQWLEQTRATLKATPPDGPTPPAEQIALTSDDGVRLRAYFVPALAPTRGVSAVLVHGLFRGGLELETVGRWLRELGCDVLLLELRNHGGSGRTAASFGPNEARDVRAASAWLRARTPDQPLVLFGVSLGTVAVALAAPTIEGLAGVILDAPILDVHATAERMLARSARGQPRRLGLLEPFRSASLFWLQVFAGVDMNATRPAHALARLPATLSALVIGGGRDDRVTPDDMRAAFAQLASPADRKELWLQDAAEHGNVWNVDPAGYRARLATFLERVR
jgi:alpha-beta hydrolase superfamily lysophospholipase